MLDLLPHILNGLVLGLLFALIALGFMLIVGLMEQINLAHGSLFALGAYIALQLTGPKPPLPPTWRRCGCSCRFGWRYGLALVIAPCLAGLVGIAVEVCMRRTYGKDPLYGLLLTFGAALVIEEMHPAHLGYARLRAAGAAVGERRLHLPGSDLVDLSVLCRRHRRRRHRPRLAADREDALWRDDQGRRS